MPGYIEDRWWTKKPDPATGKKRKTARYGQGKRYRVAGIPGVRDRSFEKLGGPDGAQAWLAKAQHESVTGEFVDPRRGEITLGAYIDDHWWPTYPTRDPATVQTVASRVTHIKTLLGEQPLKLLRAPQMRAFLKELEERVGASTTHEVWGYLSAILQSAVEDERIRKNPCKTKSITLPTIPERRVQPWSKPRILAVRSALTARFQAMVDVGVGAGLRQGEVFGLSADDVDEDEQVIHVRRQVKKVGAKLVFALPKGRKIRTVPAPEYLLKQLAAHTATFPPQDVSLPWADPAPPTTEKEAKERAPQTHRLIFTSPTGCALRRDSFDLRAWKPALAQVGIIPAPESVRQGARGRQVKKYATAPGDGFHVLRHTYASVQLDAREPIVAVSRWLGHADPAITLKIYAHMMPEADGRGRAAMDAWFTDDS
ncbi:tyrosine-type recombinase/integrase [Streptomyces smyrnaeus]|uniref:tyrosine-type recombinase/integrase n=1 Tax=Streptomyces smyrnaeus TaxID=1387713 RepID=UPI0033CC0A40